MNVKTKFHEHVKRPIRRVKASIIISALVQILTLPLEDFADKRTEPSLTRKQLQANRPVC